jgi:hypothetical protein
MIDIQNKLEIKPELGNSTKPLLVVVFIDEFGHLVDEKTSKFKVVLSGSYSWCFVGKCWRHEIKDINPRIPLSYILSDAILVK